MPVAAGQEVVKKEKTIIIIQGQGKLREFYFEFLNKSHGKLK